MDLQKHNQELSLPDDMLLVKVPDSYYQEWWRLADHWNQFNYPIHERQENLLALMSEWLRNEYPGYSLVTFQDLSSDEAQVFSQKYNQNITWGMYVLLQIGGSMQPISITNKLLEL